MWSASSSAHGPVRQKLKESMTIEASPETVWNKLKDFGTVNWLPMVESVDATGGNVKGATRILHLKNGQTVTEELKKYDAKKMSYAYKIKDMSIVKTINHAGVDEPIKVLPVTDYAATITVKSNGKNSEVLWKAAYYRGYMNNNPPEALNEEAARKAVQAVFLAGLQKLKAIAESNQSADRSKASNNSASTTTETAAASSAIDQQSETSSDADYPATNFEPKVLYLDKKTVQKNTTAFDANYPATNFEPKVLYLDKKSLQQSAMNKGETTAFDPKYPAASFKPKVIFP